MARVGRAGGADGKPVGTSNGDNGASAGAARLAQLRERWRNASLKTSFMAYMLLFLIAALVLSLTTSALFGSLQNEATADAYEISGLYLYDKETDSLVAARSIEVTSDSRLAFVQSARDGMQSIARAELPESTAVADASDYSFVYDFNYESSGEQETPELTFGTEATLENLPAYDAWARERFDAWLAENPDSPYAPLFSLNTAEGSAAEGPMTSPVGYYLSTPASPSALALSSLFGFLSFLMFPLWFGVCIFAAARRFFRMRLAPGLAVLDNATEKIAKQDLDFTVARGRDDELGRLAQSFETMRASLAESQKALWRTAEERKRLNAAFAHDLRTPLTILKGKIELLDTRIKAGTASPEQLEASTASLSAQVERLERYVAAMSSLQKLEDREPERSDIAFSRIAELIEDAGNGLARSNEARFALFASQRCACEQPSMRVDGSLVSEVAENLLANAFRYASKTVSARLDVRPTEHEGCEELVLIVDDDGPGFSCAALKNGCAPFFSETPSKERFGLGLNISSLLCDKHGGSLTLENRPEGGARVTARFACRP